MVNQSGRTAAWTQEAVPEPAQEMPKTGSWNTINTQSSEELPADLQCQIHPVMQAGPPKGCPARAWQLARRRKQDAASLPVPPAPLLLAPARKHVSAARHPLFPRASALLLELLRITLNIRYGSCTAKGETNVEKLSIPLLGLLSCQTVSNPHASSTGCPLCKSTLRWTNTGHTVCFPHPLVLQPVWVISKLILIWKISP